MSLKSLLVMLTATGAATVVSAHANAGERSQPGDLAVWMFLGLCALIVVAQIIPLLRQVKKHSARVAESSEASEQSRTH